MISSLLLLLFSYFFTFTSIKFNLFFYSILIKLYFENNKFLINIYIIKFKNKFLNFCYKLPQFLNYF